MAILLNDRPIRFEDADFPMIIHAREGLGASFFVVNLMAELFRQGWKLLFFTAFHMAKDDLKQLLGTDGLARTEFVTGREAVAGRQAVVVSSGEAADLAAVRRRLPDLDERIVLIKNIERYGREVLDGLADQRRLILAGDIDLSPFAPEIWARGAATRLYFSRPATFEVGDLPELPKFQGFAAGRRLGGLVRLG